MFTFIPPDPNLLRYDLLVPGDVITFRTNQDIVMKFGKFSRNGSYFSMQKYRDVSLNTVEGECFIGGKNKGYQAYRLEDILSYSAKKTNYLAGELKSKEDILSDLNFNKDAEFDNDIVIKLYKQISGKEISYVTDLMLFKVDLVTTTFIFANGIVKITNRRNQSLELLSCGGYRINGKICYGLENFHNQMEEFYGKS